MACNGKSSAPLVYYSLCEPEEDSDLQISMYEMGYTGEEVQTDKEYFFEMPQERE